MWRLFLPALTAQNQKKDRPMAEQNWWQRLNSGLRRTSAAITGAIFDLASKRKLDAAMIEEIEEVLIRADLGVTWRARSRRRSPRGATTR